MKNLFDIINKKVNNIIITLAVNGFILLVLAVLVAWYNFMVRLTMALVILIIAYTCFYVAYKVWKIKKEVSHKILDKLIK
jgi:Ca2+/Na+ antiporter